MTTPASVTRLIHLLRSPDTAVRDMAAGMIWQRYFRELLSLARRNLDRRARHRADEEDVLQSMFRSFCIRQGRGDFHLADRNELWRLLVTITLRKARNIAKAQRRDKRDVEREQAAVTDAGCDSKCASWELEQMDAAGPSPAEAALLNEALERRLESLADSGLRQIAIWRLEGYTNHEIADRLDCTERSVERKLERIRSKWSACDDEQPSRRRFMPQEGKPA
jgi:DNA-directed RNA polymerase specialized sigma24 family protein